MVAICSAMVGQGLCMVCGRRTMVCTGTPMVALCSAMVGQGLCMVCGRRTMVCTSTPMVALCSAMIGQGLRMVYGRRAMVRHSLRMVGCSRRGTLSLRSFSGCLRSGYGPHLLDLGNAQRCLYVGCN